MINSKWFTITHKKNSDISRKNINYIAHVNAHQFLKKKVSNTSEDQLSGTDNSYQWPSNKRLFKSALDRSIMQKRDDKLVVQRADILYNRRQKN